MQTDVQNTFKRKCTFWNNVRFQKSVQNPLKPFIYKGYRDFKIMYVKFWFSPMDTPYEQRAVAPGTDQRPYSQFEVVKPIEAVEEGKIAPWFDEPGGGIQYEMPDSIANLIEEGYLRRI